MKKIFTYTTILMSIILLQSCSKQSPNEMLSPRISSTDVNVTIKSDGTYQLALDNFQNAVISKQASHFQLSEISLDSKTALLVYKYQPSPGFVGVDEVLLSTSKNIVSESMGGGCNNSGSAYHASTVTSSLSIKLNVTAK